MDFLQWCIQLKHVAESSSRIQLISLWLVLYPRCKMRLCNKQLKVPIYIILISHFLLILEPTSQVTPHHVMNKHSLKWIHKRESSSYLSLWFLPQFLLFDQLHQRNEQCLSWEEDQRYSIKMNMWVDVTICSKLQNIVRKACLNKYSF
jgi:hypothetical protein